MVWEVNADHILTGNQPNHGEQEHSILAHVPAKNIVGILKVIFKEDVNGVNKPEYVEMLNPNYQP